MPRDELQRKIRQALADRVGLHCSNPECRRLTSGPAADPRRALNIGVAAHITAASPGGPRYNPVLTSEERASIHNGIWLCQSCAALVDRDLVRFTVTLLQEWKELAERVAAKAICAGSGYRSIAASEVRQELTIGELVAVRALSEEFGCHVESEIHVPAGDGWLRLDGAVVRGEDLIAIDILENSGRGIPYFQVEHLLALCARLKFPRFQKCAVCLVVVSCASAESDEDVRSRLEALAGAAEVEVHIRMYRLNSLRAKYEI